jgi:hypothetical protein
VTIRTLAQAAVEGQVRVSRRLNLESRLGDVGCGAKTLSGRLKAGEAQDASTVRVDHF